MCSFILLPILVYLLSYLPFQKLQPDQPLWKLAVDNGVDMLNYHKGEMTWHPYQSPWYSWLITWRPLLDAFCKVGDGKVSSIATFGNPFLFLLGLLAVFYNIYLWRVKRDTKAAFLTVAYFAMLIPWTFVHRTVFIYQYFVCSILMMFSIGNGLISFGRKGKKELYLCVGVAGLLFVLFYPELSGLAVSEEWIDRVLEWMPFWDFA